MARNKSSRINFDIDIKGVNDAKELTSLMPKLITQFNQLAESVDRVEQNKNKIKDVKEGIIMMDVGVIKGEIKSLKDLGRAYGVLVNQINALEKRGEPVAQLRKDAIQQHQRLRKQILASGEAMESQAGKMQRAGQQMAQVNQQVGAMPSYTRNASYAWLNMGYIIQDSPYGIMGISNNISQLITSMQLLEGRLGEINQQQGTNITKWQALRATLMGPTGMALILGSVIPAALVLVARYWDEITEAMGGTAKGFEDFMSVTEEFIKLQKELTEDFGEDPLNIKAMRKELNEYTFVLEDLEEIHEGINNLNKTRRQAFQAGGSTGAYGVIGLPDISLEEIAEAEERVEGLREEFEGLEAVDLEELRKKIAEVKGELVFSEVMRNRSSLLTLQSAISQSTANIVRDIDLFSDPEIEGELLEGAEDHAEKYLQFLTDRMLEFTASGEYDMARVVKANLDLLRDALEEEDEEDKKKKEKEEEKAVIDEQYEMRKQMQEDLQTLRIYGYEQMTAQAETSEEKITAIQAEATEKMIAINRKEYDNFYQRELDKRKLANETAEKIEEVRKNASLNELEMTSASQQFDLGSPQSYSDRISSIESFYDTQAEIIRRSEENVEKRRVQLHKNELDRKKALADSEIELNERKRAIQSNWTEFAITSFQAVAQAFGQSAKAQFQIQKVISASKAVINAREGFTKTLAQGGFLAKPLAFSTLALGLAQAAAIMSQSYEGASSGASQSIGAGSFNSFSSYRGYQFEGSDSFQGNSYEGNRSVSAEASPRNQMMPNKVQAVFTDGFGKVVSEGTIQLQKQNKDNLGYWSNG